MILILPVRWLALCVLETRFLVGEAKTQRFDVRINYNRLLVLLGLLEELVDSFWVDLLARAIGLELSKLLECVDKGADFGQNNTSKQAADDVDKG